MKRIGLCWSLLVICATTAVVARSEDIQVVKSGKLYGNVFSYKVEGDYYLGAKEAADVYGASLYWHPVRGMVQLSLRGRQVALRVDSDEASVDGRAVKLPRPVLLRTSRAFIPIEFFTGAPFSGVAGTESRFNPKTRVLLVERSASVGPMRYFTYPDHTRIVMELKDGGSYQTSRRGRRGFEVVVSNAMLESPEKAAIGDGAVEYAHLEQEGNLVRLTLSLMEGASECKVMELSDPRRIVIDVMHAPPLGARERPVDMSPAPLSAKRDAALEADSRRACPPYCPASDQGARDAPSGAVPAVPARKAQPVRRRIAIDAGHGGKDGGATGWRRISEKAVNLRAAKELAQLFKEEGIFDVMMTRDSDEFIPLADRARKANEAGADIFISLHCNAHPSRSESGFEVYFLSERASDPEAERLAEFENSVRALEGDAAVEDEAAGLLYALARTEFINDAAELAGLITRRLDKRVDLPNRGVKQADFYVLRGANSPAVLVEMGFVSNSADAGKLKSSKYLRKIVEGVSAGVLDYAKRKEWNTGASAR